MRPIDLRRAVGSAVLAVALASPHAAAQNALGDGTSLDNNLQIGRPQNTRVRDLGSEIAFRNAIVTGNAANFQSFRGDVGYTAAADFRDFLGSDDTFAFRRDSLTSGLAGLGIRGTSALQYQFALSTGSTPPDGLVGGLTVGRAGFNVSNPVPTGAGDFRPNSQQAQGIAVAPNDPFDPAGDFSRRDGGALFNALRSPSVYTANQGLSPMFLARFEVGSEGMLGLTASELRSVRATPLAVDGDFGRIEQPEEDARGTSAIDTRIDAQGGAAKPADAFLPNISPETVHADLLERFSTIPGPGGETSTRGQLEILRRLLAAPEQFDLNAGEPQTPDAQAPDSQTPAPGTPPVGTPAPDGAASPTASGTQVGPPQIAQRERDIRARIAEVDPKLVRTIRTAERIGRLIDEDRARGTAYGEHIMAGERLLARGRYFEAEERFVQALAVRRGDVTAQIGRVHSQIGAGLFVSAAVNLRSLLSEHPEVAGARYDADLLPTTERLSRVLTDLEALIDTNGESRIGLAAGLLLAYLGYQTDDRDALDRAFSIFADPKADNFEGITDARLGGLLRTLWYDPPREASPASEPGG